jgi:hypothetical protein
VITAVVFPAQVGTLRMGHILFQKLGPKLRYILVAQSARLKPLLNP